jgi:hypothetical protein
MSAMGYDYQHTSHGLQTVKVYECLETLLLDSCCTDPAPFTAVAGQGSSGPLCIPQCARCQFLSNLSACC